MILDPDTAQLIGVRGIYPNLDATTEVVLTRELVDHVDPDLVRTAVHCQATPEGMLTCPNR